MGVYITSLPPRWCPRPWASVRSPLSFRMTRNSLSCLKILCVEARPIHFGGFIQWPSPESGRNASQVGTRIYLYEMDYTGLSPEMSKYFSKRVREVEMKSDLSRRLFAGLIRSNLLETRTIFRRSVVERSTARVSHSSPSRCVEALRIGVSPVWSRPSNIWPYSSRGMSLAAQICFPSQI